MYSVNYNPLALDITARVATLHHTETFEYDFIKPSATHCVTQSIF